MEKKARKDRDNAQRDRSNLWILILVCGMMSGLAANIVNIIELLIYR